MTETPETPTPSDVSAEADRSSAPLTTGDRALLAAFWVWAVLLLVATVAQLAGWQGVLDVLDVKRWFAQ